MRLRRSQSNQVMDSGKMEILTKESNPVRLSFMRLIFKNKGNINIFDYFQVKLISFEKAQESWQLDADAKLEQVSGWVEIISQDFILH